MGFDYAGIRERLMKLKEQAKLDNYEFCKIYAPEKCTTKENAENFISAVFSGRRYPTATSKHLVPEIEHLNNIVESDRFSQVTLNYLVYGDETPAKTVEKIDFNPEHWTVADFCVFLGKVMDAHPSIKIESELIEEPYTYNGEELSDTNHYLAIRFLEYDGECGVGYDLGGALRAFTDAFKTMKELPSKTTRDVMYKQIVNAMNSDERFSKSSLSSRGENSFIDCDEDGEKFVGLSID